MESKTRKRAPDRSWALLGGIGNVTRWKQGLAPGRSFPAEIRAGDAQHEIGAEGRRGRGEAGG